jgi:hypothetical protein
MEHFDSNGPVIAGSIIIIVSFLNKPKAIPKGMPGVLLQVIRANI